MNKQKARCHKCGKFEVELVERSANPFDTRPMRYVCKHCGEEYEFDSGISVINQKTVNTFPNPKTDLDVDDSFTKHMKSKFEKEVY